MSMYSSNRGDVHQTSTLLPPAESEPPPTARWTPPPALIESSRFGSAEELHHLAELSAVLEAEHSRVERAPR
jgi:hypothetical protein